jgi:hypothetical protein
MNRLNIQHPGTILVIFALSVMTVSIKGQPFDVGFFGGINVSEVSGDSYTGFNKLGLTAGLFVNNLIGHDVYWQAEIKYGTRGAYKGPSDIDPTLYRSGYQVIELPLSVQYLYEERVFVEAGFSPEVLIASRFWDENGLLDPAAYPENRRFGLSVFAGIGYWFNEKIQLGVRYTNSAIPFRDPQEWNHPRYRGFYHSLFSLTVAYRFSHL